MSFAAWIIAGVVAMGPQVTYPEDQFGSVAVCFETEAFGYSRNMPSQSWADDVAVKQCQESGGRSCQVILHMRNGCGAVALGDERITTGNGKTPEAAALAALQQCRRDTDNCSVALNLCMDRID